MRVLLAWREVLEGEYELFRRQLGGLAEVVAAPGRDERMAMIPEADVIVAGHVTREEVMAARRLKFLQVLQAGVERLDLRLLRERGVVVASAKGANARSVAEMALALMLTLARRVAWFHEEMRRGVFARWEKGNMGVELAGRTVVVLGYGNIGVELGRIASGLGMRVIGVRRRPRPAPYADAIVSGEELGEVVGEADFLVVALPLTGETRGVVNKDVLLRMKRGSFLVNVGRGPVVDEEALYEALTRGWVAGAGLDTWWHYPPDPRAPSHLGIHLLPNVVAVPHKGGWTPEARWAVMRFAAENVARWLRGMEPRGVVDMEAGY